MFPDPNTDNGKISFMKRSILIPLVFFICLLITSCASDIEPDDPPVSFDSLHINKEISMAASQEFNTFRTGDTIALFVLYNIVDTDIEVVFPNNFNMRIFIKQSKDWIEIKERAKIRLFDKVTLSPTNNRSLLIFTPVLPDLNQRYEMRVYVFGEMVYPDGIQQVVAFVDFILRP